MSNTEILTHSRYTAPTQGLFSLSWPIFIDLAMHYLTVTINIYMVSMISLQAVAELNVGSQAFQLAFTLFNFVNIGVCVCCAQALGKVLYEELFTWDSDLTLSGASVLYLYVSLEQV